MQEKLDKIDPPQGRNTRVKKRCDDVADPATQVKKILEKAKADQRAYRERTKVMKADFYKVKRSAVVHLDKY